MTAPDGFARAVCYVCIAVVVVFMIRCVQTDAAKGRCTTWMNGTITCSGAACEHCTPLVRPVAPEPK